MMECTICCVLGGELYSLECGHSYHTDCIMEWFRRGSSSCPLCRSTSFRAMLAPASRSERVKRMIQAAKCPSAPVRLRNLVERYRERMRMRKEAREEERAFRRRHTQVLRTARKLDRRRSKHENRLEVVRDEICAFSHPNIPVPLLAPVSDDDETE